MSAGQAIEALAAAPRPNIVLIIADDLSASDLGVYGNKDVRTPELDRLAGKGLRWTNAFLTSTVCSASRASIVTSRYPHNTGAADLHVPLPAGLATLPGQLRKAGYWCGHAGKWHIGEHPKNDYDVVNIGHKKNGVGGVQRWIPLLRDRPKDKPFFLWLASYDAHRGWFPDAEGEPHDPDQLNLPEPLVDTPETRADLAAFYDEVQRLDRYVGKVVAELDRQGVLDETLILFISDNGRPFPRAKRWITDEGIRTPWILHWPEGLGSESGGVCHQLVSSIDIAPTFLALAGAKVPESMQGLSFLPQVKDPETKICDYVFAERNWQVETGHERTLRYKDWSYYRNAFPEHIHFGFVNATYDRYSYPSYVDLWRHYQEGGTLTEAQQSVFLQPRPKEQLFNRSDDPLELNDLANDPEHQDILLQLRKVMERWIEETGDTIPARERLTPDRHDRLTGERLFKGMHPGHGQYESAGDSKNAIKIDSPGPR